VHADNGGRRPQPRRLADHYDGCFRWRNSDVPLRHVRPACRCRRRRPGDLVHVRRGRSTVDAQGENDGRFTYDGHRRVTGVDTTGEPIEYEYDGGELVRRVQDGERTEYAYDRRGRLIRSAGPLGQIVDYVYDRDGSLLRASSTIGVTRFTYDGAGLLTSVVPAVGDEVVVSFEHGDLNAPVSVGFLWSEDGGDSFTVTPRGRLRTCSTCP
jgi:YD repeat-containing protein